MQSEWELSRSTGHCAATGRPLAERESYYAVLFETPAGFERKDYAPEAWAGPPAGHFCYWRARVPVKDKPAGFVPVDCELLTQFFLRLEDADSAVKQHFRFVLALLLMRKRILRFEKSQREGDCEYWVLRLASEQSEHRVLNPRLTEEEVARLSRQLTALLSGDAQAIESLESQEPPAPAASDAPAPPESAHPGSAAESEDEIAAP